MLQRFAPLQVTRLLYNIVAVLFIIVILLSLWWGNVFMTLRLRFNDLYYSPTPTTDSIVIIALDDDSLNRYGRTPSEWDRMVYIDLINQLIPTNIRVLAFDLLFSQAKIEDEAFADALRALRQSDARTRIVLADAGINNIAYTLNLASQQAIPALPFSDDLPLSEVLLTNSDYTGYTNVLPDIDGIVRRQASLIAINDLQFYSLSISTFLAYRRIPQVAAAQTRQFADGLLSITPDTQIPVDDFGLWQPYYYGAPATAQATTFPIISLVDIVDGNFDPSLLDDKIVLVGLINNVGTLDQYQVPSATSGNLMSGVEIQANAVETLLQSYFPQQLSAGLHMMLIATLAIFTAFLYTYPQWYGKLILLLAIIVAWILASSFIFSTTLIAISLWDTLLAIILPFFSALIIDITFERLQRQQIKFLLDSLQQITEQNLQLKQIVPFILSDVRKIAPEINAGLYIRESEQSDTFIGFRYANHSDNLRTETYTLNTIPSHQNTTTMPIIWQSRLHGFMVTEHVAKQSITAATRSLLQDFMSKLAPIIDNLMLYQALERQKLLLESIFSESPASIAVLDKAGMIVDCNEDLAILLKTDIKALFGQSFVGLLSSQSDDDTLEQHLSDGFANTQNFAIEEININDLRVRLDASPLKSYALWTVVIGDITALAELSELKTQLLRIAAHDLKNPLARIIGFAEILEMQLSLDEQQAKYMGYINDGSQEMLNIINDILSVERLRSGKLVLEEINFTRLVREVCASHQPDIIQKQQTFELITPETPIHVNADLGQLSQAVTNFVGNAVKYTPNNGAITVRIIENETGIRFEVQDTGYGIPDASKDSIFTAFYRVKSASTRHIEGTGLGLNLVKSVIEAHHGQVNFISEEGVGSTFYFTLPPIKQ